MSKSELIDALCPEKEDWKTMPQDIFQERVGKCLRYLLERDQQSRFKTSASSFLGGIVGGIGTVLTFLGIRG